MRVTLDTNQLIRAVMRPPQLATFVMAWEARRFAVVSSRQLLDEFQFVIAEPDVAELIYPELRRLFFGHLLPEIELVELPTIPLLCRGEQAIISKTNHQEHEVDNYRHGCASALIAAGSI